MKIIITESQLKNLLERDSKPYWVLYHHTDSDFFDTLNHSLAKKGERFFNPLGNGLYCSTNKEFGKSFGKNTFYYLLPKNSKIKIVTQNKWYKNDFWGYLTKVLRKYKLNFYDLSIDIKIIISRIANNEPIESLNELEVVLREDLKLDNIQEVMESVMDERNSAYDAIWYRTTNYYNEADEIVIPTKSFKKEYFVKELPEG
jgi:hypothetical protein